MKVVNKKGIEFIIRKATANDANGVLNHVRTVGDETNFLTFSGSEFNLSLEEEIKVIEDHNNSDNQIFIIAEVNGNIVGVANMMASPKKRLRHLGEFGISVLKDYWGKGVGSAMIKFLIEWAQNTAQLTKINLIVQNDNIRAFELYKKLGFEKEGELRRALYVDGKYYDAYYMGMLL